MAEQTDKESKQRMRGTRARLRAARTAATAARETGEDAGETPIEDVEVIEEIDGQEDAAPQPSEVDDESGAALAPLAVLDHFRASRLPIGDVVMAARRRYDTERRAPEALELRVFLASAPDRARLVELGPNELMAEDGGLLFAQVEFPPKAGEYHWNVAEGRRARIGRIAVHGAGPDEQRATSRELAEWIVGTLEAELRFAGIAVVDVPLASVDDAFAAELAVRGYASSDDAELLSRELAPRPTDRRPS